MFFQGLKQSPKGVLIKMGSENMQKICRKQPCESVILSKLESNFIANTLPHNLPYIFRTSFYKNTFEVLLVQRSVLTLL